MINLSHFGVFLLERFLSKDLISLLNIELFKFPIALCVNLTS